MLENTGRALTKVACLEATMAVPHPSRFLFWPQGRPSHLRPLNKGRPQGITSLYIGLYIGSPDRTPRLIPCDPRPGRPRRARYHHLKPKEKEGYVT